MQSDFSEILDLGEADAVQKHCCVLEPDPNVVGVWTPGCQLQGSTNHTTLTVVGKADLKMQSHRTVTMFQLFKYQKPKCPVQWGSEIQTSLDLKWLKRGWVANGQDLELAMKSVSPNIWNLDKLQPFCQKTFDIWTKMSGFWTVRFLNGWDNSFSHSWSIWQPDHLKFDQKKSSF